RRIGDQPEARDAPVGGLEAVDAAPARGLADGAAGVGAQRGGGDPGGDGRGRPAAAPAGGALVVPGIARGAEDGELGGAPHAELVEVRLTDDDRAGVDQTLRGRGGEGGAVVLEVS